HEYQSAGNQALHLSVIVVGSSLILSNWVLDSPPACLGQTATDRLICQTHRAAIFAVASAELPSGAEARPAAIEDALLTRLQELEAGGVSVNLRELYDENVVSGSTPHSTAIFSIAIQILTNTPIRTKRWS